jgi:hypothetical protein
MRTLTFGTLPDVRAFQRAFDAAGLPASRYHVRAGLGGLFHGTRFEMTFQQAEEFTSLGLYTLLEQLVGAWECGSEAAGQEASDILTTLGFEWV